MLLGDLTSYRRTIEPTSEPVTLDRAKEALRVTGTDDDNYITDLIKVAREYAEEFTGRAFLEQVWDATFDQGKLPRDGIIELPRPPLKALRDRILYLDTEGVLQYLPEENYTVDHKSTPGRIQFENMPAIKDTFSALYFRYRAGYDSVDAVPNIIKQAILYMVVHFYENRTPVVIGTITATVPNTVEALLRPLKVHYL